MRLIDADALMEKLNGIWDCNDMVFEPVDGCCIDADCKSCRWRETIEYVKRLVQNQTTITPWRGVEEPPEMKETKELPGFFMSGLCALFDRYSKVFDLGYATRSNYMGGGIKWHSVYATRPTHWMPIEFPIGFQKKEDA